MKSELRWFKGVVDCDYGESIPKDGFYIGIEADGYVIACTKKGRRVAGGGLLNPDFKSLFSVNESLGFDLERHGRLTEDERIRLVEFVKKHRS